MITELEDGRRRATVAGSLKPGEALAVGAARIVFAGDGHMVLRVGGTHLELKRVDSRRVAWVSVTEDGPHPRKLKPGEAETPLVIVGPGGDFRRCIYPTDLAAPKRQESDNDTIAGATAEAGSH